MWLSSENLLTFRLMTEHKYFKLIHIHALAASCVQPTVSNAVTGSRWDSLGGNLGPPIRIPQPQPSQSAEGRQVEGRHSTHLHGVPGMACAGVETCTCRATQVCRGVRHVMGKRQHARRSSSAGGPAERAQIHIGADTRMTT